MNEFDKLYDLQRNPQNYSPIKIAQIVWERGLQGRSRNNWEIWIMHPEMQNLPPRSQFGKTRNTQEFFTSMWKRFYVFRKKRLYTAPITAQWNVFEALGWAWGEALYWQKGQPGVTTPGRPHRAWAVNKKWYPQGVLTYYSGEWVPGIHQIPPPDMDQVVTHHVSQPASTVEDMVKKVRGIDALLEWVEPLKEARSVYSRMLKE